MFGTSLSAAPRTPSPARAPDGLRLYAVGDVHGRLDLLGEMARRIEADLGTLDGRRAETILLGDYVDRGPASAGVVDRLARGDWPTPLVALRGNHEDVLLRFLEDAATLDRWRRFGGLETLHSYGAPIEAARRGAEFEATRAAFAAALPAAHRRFFETTALSATRGDYFFCHAGVRPGVALERQRAEDLLWIRGEFLEHAGDFGKVVVHGHTPAEAPELCANRVNVDTGAYASGLLTALALQDDSRRFLFAKTT